MEIKVLYAGADNAQAKTYVTVQIALDFTYTGEANKYRLVGVWPQQSVSLPEARTTIATDQVDIRFTTSPAMGNPRKGSERLAIEAELVAEGKGRYTLFLLADSF